MRAQLNRIATPTTLVGPVDHPNAKRNRQYTVRNTITAPISVTNVTDTNRIRTTVTYSISSG